MKKIIMVILLALFSGCGLQVGPVKIPDGFQVQFGINNINHVDDRKGLNVHTTKGERY